MSEQYQRSASAAHDEGGGITRRELLLDTLVGVALLGPLVAVVASVVRYLVPPAATITSATERLQVATTSDLSDGQSKDFIYNQGAHVLIRLGDQYRAFDKKCTHLGCLVEWKPKDRVFWCPCHNGVFDATGAVISGAPPRPLPKLTVEVAEGKVYVRG